MKSTKSSVNCMLGTRGAKRLRYYTVRKPSFVCSRRPAFAAPTNEVRLVPIVRRDIPGAFYATPTFLTLNNRKGDIRP